MLKFFNLRGRGRLFFAVMRAKEEKIYVKKISSMLLVKYVQPLLEKKKKKKNLKATSNESSNRYKKEKWRLKKKHAKENDMIALSAVLMKLYCTSRMMNYTCFLLKQHECKVGGGKKGDETVRINLRLPFLLWGGKRMGKEEAEEVHDY